MSDNITTICKAIEREDFENAIIKSAGTHISHAESEAVLLTLLQAHVSKGISDLEAIENVYSLLDNLGGALPDLACRIMIHLQEWAGCTCLHHVCDSIGLHIWYNANAGLAEYIRGYQHSDPNSALRFSWDAMLQELGL